MPITLQFGAWAPDQADTPVQIPDTNGPVTMPIADCLNVYYQNGSYKSIAAPKASTIDGNTVQALNAQALSAFSYYDNVAGQETVFVGTSVGIQQLQANGSWSAVPFITSQSVSLIGAALVAATGNFANTLTLRGIPLGFALGTLNASGAGISFVAGQYFYSAQSFYQTGYNALGAHPIGTLVSSNVGFGTLEQCFDGKNGAVLSVAASADPGQNVFTTIASNGITFTSASAAYIYSVGVATWNWNGTFFGYAPGSTYVVVIQ